MHNQDYSWHSATQRLGLILCAVCVLVILPSASSASAAPQVPTSAVGTFRAPLAHKIRVLTAFDNPRQQWLPGHRGVDLAATVFDLVLSPASGVVAFSGMVAGRPVVSIDHPDGIRTTYEPVVGSVHAGDSVAVGTPLGRVLSAHPGCPDETCLHWGARLGEDIYIDPLLLLDRNARPIRLKPLQPGDSQ